MPAQLPDFSNTQTAFAYKSNFELIKSYQVFRLININWLVKIGTRLTSRMMDMGFKIPIALAMRPTVYSIFCGGKSLENAKNTVEALYAKDVESILDYGVEAKETEADFDRAAAEVLRAIDFASDNPAVNYISSKFTGLLKFNILEKLHQGSTLSEAEAADYARALERIEKICAHAAEKKVGLFIDAEESWIQKPLDSIAEKMMRKYNIDRPIVYGTVQVYLKDRFSYLSDSINKAREDGYIFAAKIVRGAYMEKEAARAKQMNYPNPIQPDKATTDRVYNEAVELALTNLDHMAVCVATHNESSCLLACEIMRLKNIEPDHQHVYFSQLMGMSDHITFNLAKAGYRASKYMPYGPVEDVIPYLVRRAQENTSVGGQMGRELALLKAEIRRRKMTTV